MLRSATVDLNRSSCLKLRTLRSYALRFHDQFYLSKQYSTKINWFLFEQVPDVSHSIIMNTTTTIDRRFRIHIIVPSSWYKDCIIASDIVAITITKISTTHIIDRTGPSECRHCAPDVPHDTECRNDHEFFVKCPCQPGSEAYRVDIIDGITNAMGIILSFQTIFVLLPGVPREDFALCNSSQSFEVSWTLLLNIINYTTKHNLMNRHCRTK